MPRLTLMKPTTSVQRQTAKPWELENDVWSAWTQGGDGYPRAVALASGNKTDCNTQ